MLFARQPRLCIFGCPGYTLERGNCACQGRISMRLLFGALVCAMSVLVSIRTLAQAPPESKSEATPPERAPIELFTAPHPKHIDLESFPSSQVDNEGWV